MDNPDIRLAKRELHENNLNLIIVKRERIVFETGAHGIGGFLLAIEKLGKKMVGSAVADRIVGRAAALLCAYGEVASVFAAYGEVASVFAVTISEDGMQILRENAIPCEYENVVSNILSYDRTDICPFEKLAADLRNPKEAYAKLKQEIGSSMNRTP